MKLKMKAKNKDRKIRKTNVFNVVYYFCCMQQFT